MNAPLRDNPAFDAALKVADLASQTERGGDVGQAIVIAKKARTLLVASRDMRSSCHVSSIDKMIARLEGKSRQSTSDAVVVPLARTAPEAEPDFAEAAANMAAALRDIDAPKRKVSR